jgi:hypothetical protein
VPADKLKEKNKNKIFLASLKSLKKGDESGVGSGSTPKCHGSPTLVFSTYGSEGVKPWKHLYPYNREAEEG